MDGGRRESSSERKNPAADRGRREFVIGGQFPGIVTRPVSPTPLIAKRFSLLPRVAAAADEGGGREKEQGRLCGGGGGGSASCTAHDQE